MADERPADRRDPISEVVIEPTRSSSCLRKGALLQTSVVLEPVAVAMDESPGFLNAKGAAISVAQIE